MATAVPNYGCNFLKGTGHGDRHPLGMQHIRWKALVDARFKPTNKSIFDPRRRPFQTDKRIYF